MLTACVTPSSPPVPQPTTDPRLCQPIKAEPDVRGALVAPVTDQERADLAAFLTGEAAAGCFVSNITEEAYAAGGTHRVTAYIITL